MELTKAAEITSNEKPYWIDANLPADDRVQKAIDGKSDTVVPIFDVLGLYFCSDHHIEIDVAKCQRYAKALRGATGDDVQKIVLLHEYAHHITHVGLRCGVTSTLFEDNKSEIEPAAQLLCFLYLVGRCDPEGERLLQLFRQMSYRSPVEYRKWEKYHRRRIDEAFLGARRIELWTKCKLPIRPLTPEEFVELL